MVCKPCLFNINQPTCEAERYHGTYLPLNLLSEPVFKHANVLVDFGRFDLALLWIFFLWDWQNTKTPTRTKTHVPDATVNGPPFAYILGFEMAGIFILILKLSSHIVLV